MAIKLKTRVALGVGFLFVLLLLVGGVGFYYFNKISTDSRDVLKDNNKSVEYGRKMLDALNTWEKEHDTAHKIFEENLAAQESNVTEKGEQEVTNDLRRDFAEFLRHDDSMPLQLALQKNISRIIQINLNAINKKNALSDQAVENAKVIITVIITVCLLIGFTFMVNFPGLIANPISKLTEGIQAIANKDYSQRIHLDRKDEFGDLAKAFNDMAEQLNEYEHSNLAKIMFEKQRAETVINSMKDASIGIDKNGTVLFANQQALQLLNLKDADIVGKKQEDVQRRNDLFRFLTNEENGMPFKIVVNEKENYFTKEQIDIKQEQETIGHVIILKNITPYKELDVAKTNFIATISHELKTPLASSDFSLRLLEDERIGKLTIEQKELVQHLKDDNQRLLRILSELLDLSQVESGKIQLNLQPVAVNEMINKALAAVQNAAKEKNIQIKQQLAENLPAILGDAEKAGWIINNFLTNAIRYSAQNDHIVIKAHQPDGQHIEIGVQDFGMGIDVSLQQKIFDRFYRVPGVHEKKGTGLGLAISKDFAEAMNGTIGVESTPGKGSYFFCRFHVA
ncbi:PAS domain-containing sensor histidine kinase [Niastella vici]|uniref:histidine kinase n=1 Tax=Niastella vici TaxID=1703345 RepID=A0A1V9G0F7_9BACT|nr:ATP-binding protein [Niastella vici]OQP64101.1 PAS domain-containing sensor histidine kinase [Niastella vici]